MCVTFSIDVVITEVDAIQSSRIYNPDVGTFALSTQTMTSLCDTCGFSLFVCFAI